MLAVDKIKINRKASYGSQERLRVRKMLIPPTQLTTGPVMSVSSTFLTNSFIDIPLKCEIKI